MALGSGIDTTSRGLLNRYQNILPLARYLYLSVSLRRRVELALGLF